MAEVSKCVIKRVDNLEESEYLNPFIVEFQNGTLQHYAARNLHCGVYENKKTKRQCVAVTDTDMSYMGDEDNNDVCQNFIAIRNRNTNEVQLVSASTALLAPVLRKKKTKNLDPEDHQYLERLKGLTKTFGTKKRLKTFEQQEKLRTGHSFVKNQLETSINKIVVNAKDIATSSGIGSFISSLPPCDRNAMKVRDVYNIEDIISVAEIEELKPEAQRVLEKGEEELTDSRYNYSDLYKLILKHILGAKKIGNEEKVERIAILTYSEFIIALLSAKSHHLRQKDFEVCPISPLVNKRLLDTFTVETSNGRAHTMEMTDKSICYVLILSLLLHRFTVPCKQLLASFHCKSQQFSLLCQAVGATEVVEDGVRYATLKLPLPVMSMNQRVGRGLTKRKK